MLHQLVQAELDHPDMARARVSLLVEPVGKDKDPLISVEPDVARVPASNAKLLTSLAALRALGGYRFVTESCTAHHVSGRVELGAASDHALGPTTLGQFGSVQFDANRGK